MAPTDPPRGGKAATPGTAAPQPDSPPQAAPAQGSGTPPPPPAISTSAPRGSDENPNTVTVKLAHPLSNPEHLRRLGLDVDKEGGYSTNDEVRLDREDARMLIGAGYVQVDPEDADAVSRLLHPEAYDQEQQPQG